MSTKTEQAMIWLAEYLTHSDGLRAESLQIKSDASRAGLNVRTLELAKQRLGVAHETASAPGRPFLTYWQLPPDKVTAVTSQDWADARRLTAALAARDEAAVTAALQAPRPQQRMLALAAMAAGAPGTVSPSDSDNRPGTGAPPRPVTVTEGRGSLPDCDPVRDIAAMLRAQLDEDGEAMAVLAANADTEAAWLMVSRILLGQLKRSFKDDRQRILSWIGGITAGTGVAQ